MFKHTTYSINHHKKLHWGFVVDPDYNKKQSLEELLTKTFPSFNFSFAYTRQDHSVKIQTTDTAQTYLKTDGLLTKKPFLVLCIYTADCFASLLWDEKSEALCLVHSGWQGLKQQIIKEAVLELQKQSSGKELSLKISFFPFLSVEYHEIPSYLKKSFHQESFMQKEEKLFLDMKTETLLQLKETEIIYDFLPYPKNIKPFDSYCTYETKELPSYMRDNSLGGRILHFCFIEDIS